MKFSPGLLASAAFALLGSTSFAAPVLLVGNDIDDVTPGFQAGVGDAAIVSRLNALGHTVTAVDDLASLTSDAAGKSLVIISSTVTSGNVLAKYKDVLVPVINYEPAVYDDMMMTGDVDGTTRGTITGQTQLSITSLSHPITAGLTGLQTVTTAAETFTFGQPTATADILATPAGDATRAVIFVYEKGDLLFDLSAAADKRIGFFLNDNVASVLTPVGGQLFDNTVLYAIPEPGLSSLVTMGFAGLAGLRRRRG